ncbi:MAG: sugar ABC transporter substrate-binding protein [Oscillospiraceae bacterium]
MKKNLKRVLTLILALTMVLPLVACGSEGGGKGSDELPSYNIGYNTWGAGTPVFEFMADVVKRTLDAYDATSSRANDENMADKELQNIQNFISSGVDGIIMMPAASTVLPQGADACEKAKIPFVLSVFVGEEKDRAEIRVNNKYYLGAVSADMYAEGYRLGQSAIADGYKTAVLIGGNIGDANIEVRIEGFTKSFVEEGGGRILDSARCSSPSEGQEKANALLSAYPDADCLYCVAGDYLPGAVNAMETLGLDMAIYLSNADSSAIPYIRDGSVAAAITGNDLVCAVSAALLINYLDGHQILDEEGKPPEMKLVGFALTKDNVDDYERIFFDDENFLFTDERLHTLVWRYNKDVTYDTFVDFVANRMNLDSIVADHNG